MNIARYLVIISVFLLSCEKAINIQPENLETKLVVDAQIEDGQQPVVTLSSSLSYFSSLSREALQASFVRNASVVITDGIKTHKLKEYSISIEGGYHIYYYSTDIANLATAITGSQGKTYKLTIDVNSGQYTSVTTIPVLSKTLDSLWWTPAPRTEDTPKVVLMAKVTDPAGFGNYIRYFTRANSGAFLPGANSIFDDQIVDGTTYIVQVDKGINRNEKLDEKEYGFFKKGDTATVKFCNIDKTTFDFWRTLEFGYQSVGNPFSSPVKVLGNISNGALGAFCGYSVQYKTLIIPK